MTTQTAAPLDQETVRLLCNANITLYRRSKALAEATGNHALHDKDLATIRALAHAGWHEYDANGPCPVCGRTATPGTPASTACTARKPRAWDDVPHTTLEAMEARGRA